MKAQPDRLGRIVIPDLFEENPDLDFDPEFLAQFARQTRFPALARLAFATRELPEPAEMRARRALGDQELSIQEHQRCGDLDGSWLLGNRQSAIENREVYRPTLL